MGCANSRSLANKIDELHHLLSSSNCDIFGFTESWLNPAISDAMLVANLPFNIVRMDRPSRGGGVCLFLLKSIQFVAVDFQNPSSREVVAVDIIGSSRIRFVVVYQKPNADSCAIAHLVDVLSGLCDVSHPVVVMGDFNLPNYDWTSFAHRDEVSVAFNRFVFDCGMTQFVCEPTRGERLLVMQFPNSVRMFCVTAVWPQ